MNAEISDHYKSTRGELYQARLEGAEFYRRQQAALYFAEHTTDTDTVLDFGCNDGLFLACIPARRRIGVEVNEAAIKQLVADDIEVHTDLASIPDGIIDVVISNHCLEHTLTPFDCLKELRRVLKPGGKLVVVLPFDDWRSDIHKRWEPDNPDNHLFSWSPMNIGNLLVEAGFCVEKAEHTQYALSNKLEIILRKFGRRAFLIAANLLSRYRKRSEVVAIAFRPLGGRERSAGEKRTAT